MQFSEAILFASKTKINVFWKFLEQSRVVPISGTIYKSDYSYISQKFRENSWNFCEIPFSLHCFSNFSPLCSVYKTQKAFNVVVSKQPSLCIMPPQTLFMMSRLKLFATKDWSGKNYTCFLYKIFLVPFITWKYLVISKVY